MVADFVAHIGKKAARTMVQSWRLGSRETTLPKALAETMTKNQKLAVELNRRALQDTSMLQFWLVMRTFFHTSMNWKGLLARLLLRLPLQHPPPQLGRDF